MESKGDENVQTEDNKYFQKLNWNWRVRRRSSSGDGCSTAASEENFQDEEEKKSAEQIDTFYLRGKR